MSSLLDSGVFGDSRWSSEHIIGAKAVAFQEALSDKYLTYVVQVKKTQTLWPKNL